MRRIDLPELLGQTLVTPETHISLGAAAITVPVAVEAADQDLQERPRFHSQQKPP